MIDPQINTDVSWIHDLNFVLSYGDRVAPRGMDVLESLAYQSIVDMNDPIIFNQERKLGYKFMAAEAAWILDGKNDVASISPYSKEISRFSDDGETFFGAYGPPLQEQYNYVTRTLMDDVDSRQAVATIWRQNPVPTKDVPCTVALQWLIRDSKIHCVATMRSSDLWLGHPYDVFNFSAVSFAIMLKLNYYFSHKGKWPLKLGKLFLTAGSKHIYAKNVEACQGIVEDLLVNQNSFIRPGKSPFDVTRYDSADEFVQDLWDAANSTDGALSLLRGD